MFGTVQNQEPEIPIERQTKKLASDTQKQAGMNLQNLQEQNLQHLNDQEKSKNLENVTLTNIKLKNTRNKDKIANINIYQRK